MLLNIWYLCHSGFAIKVGNRFLIFDYYRNNPDDNNSPSLLSSGVINPAEISKYEVYVFASHKHGDHHNKCIYRWRETIPNITYVLSDDIPITTSNNILRVAPHQSYIINDIQVHTLLSNDLGVAFIVQIADLCIFFSGDLNWWYWKEEPTEWNVEIEQIFKAEMQRLKNYHINYGFIPVDPRLETAYSLSLKYFIDNIANENTVIFPMHFGDNYNIFKQLEDDDFLENDNIQVIKHRGQKFEF